MGRMREHWSHVAQPAPKVKDLLRGARAMNTPSTLELQIKRCEDCPFCHTDRLFEARCFAKTVTGRRLRSNVLTPPTWCILRGGQVVLRLAKP